MCNKNLCGIVNKRAFDRNRKETEQILYKHLNFHCYVRNDQTVMELLYRIKNCNGNNLKIKKVAESVINELSSI